MTKFTANSAKIRTEWSRQGSGKVKAKWSESKSAEKQTFKRTGEENQYREQKVGECGQKATKPIYLP
jgi:hypothetical protein